MGLGMALRCEHRVCVRCLRDSSRTECPVCGVANVEPSEEAAAVVQERPRSPWLETVREAAAQHVVPTLAEDVVTGTDRVTPPFEVAVAGPEQEQPQRKIPKTIEEQREVPASANTLEDLQNAVFGDWPRVTLDGGREIELECGICATAYDNQEVYPVLVDASVDDSNIVIKGCGHTMCYPCSVKILHDRRQARPSCPVCRTKIKSFAPSLVHLEAIISLDDGRYMAHVRKINELYESLDPLNLKVLSVRIASPSSFVAPRVC